MAKQSAERLTRREREIMNAVFSLGNRASAEDIRARLTNPPGDSAVRVMLARLEKKGLLKHQQDGQRYLYSATMSHAAAKRTALQQYLQTFFGGSLKQMMTALVAESPWSEDELDALKAEIDRVRRASGSERAARTERGSGDPGSERVGAAAVAKPGALKDRKREP